MSTYSVIYNTNPYQKAQIRTQTQKKRTYPCSQKETGTETTDFWNSMLCFLLFWLRYW